MKICRVDSKKRVILPDGNPGDWMVVEESGAGTYTLKRIEIPRPARMSKATVRRLVRQTPVRMRMGWDQLKRETRES